MNTATSGFLGVLAEEKEKVMAHNEVLYINISGLEHRIFLMRPIRWWQFRRIRRRAELRAQIREIGRQECRSISALLHVIQQTEDAYRSGGPRKALGFLRQMNKSAYTAVWMGTASLEWGRTVQGGIERLRYRLDRFKFD